MELTEKHYSLMQEARAINAAEGLIYPLIEKMIAQRTDAMVSAFNGGKTEHLSYAAAISALYELKQSLRSMQAQGNLILKRIQENQNT